MDNIKRIAQRIKQARSFNDFSTKEMALKIGIEENEYIQYENGEKDLPIGLLYNIASALDLDASIILFGKSSTSKVATVVSKGKGTKIERYPGYDFVSLASDYIDRDLEPMLVTIKAGINPECVQHSGQEFNYVLKGSLRVIIENKEYYLHNGDSIYFDATKPHAQVAISDVAKFLTIIQK